MAYTNDLVLLADSEVELQQLIDPAKAFLREWSIALNKAKFFGHHGKTIMSTSTTFNTNGQSRLALSQEGFWNYLGIEFSVEGRLH